MDTKKITSTRDVRWTDKLFGESNMRPDDDYLESTDSESENENDKDDPEMIEKTDTS